MNNNEVIAVVGNREITRGDLDALIRSLDPKTAAQFRSEEGMKNLVKEIVNQELFYLDGINTELYKDEEYIIEVERAKANILKQYALNKLLGNIDVSEDEIVSYYTENQFRFSAPPSVKASHILVDSQEEAENIAGEIKGGLSFEDAANKYSKCPSKEKGGDLGFFSRGMMVPEFEAAAFEMENGQISGPVKTQFGYHLIKVIDKKEVSSKSLDEVRGQIAGFLQSQKQQSVYQKVNQLKEKYTIKINI